MQRPRRPFPRNLDLIRWKKIGIRLPNQAGTVKVQKLSQRPVGKHKTVLSILDKDRIAD